MSGLIRGKRLVWHESRAADGDVMKFASSPFGTYYVRSFDGKWSAMVPMPGGQYEARDSELDADTLCQADHDKRALSTVEVAPLVFVQDGDVWTARGKHFSASVWEVPRTAEWQWDVCANGPAFAYGIEDDKEAAITAANQFVTRLVMGE
jgi:hypothetical protein